MFQSILSGLVARVQGARGAMIVGVDGVLLETNSPALRSEAEALAAEYAVFFRTCRRVLADTEKGKLRTSLLITDQGKILFQSLTPDYFILLFLKPDSHSGKAFFEISRTCASLEEELVY